jgi:hypothetical protein
MRGKYNSNMAPAPPGRPFRTLFEGGTQIAPDAPARGRKKSVLKRTASETKELGLRSRTGLATSFRYRKGTGDTSTSPVVIHHACVYLIQFSSKAPATHICIKCSSNVGILTHTYVLSGRCFLLH